MRKKYVGLKYNPKKNNAPEVLFKFYASNSDRINNIIKNYGIPMYKDEMLVYLLEQIPVGKEIPQELFFAIARIYTILIQDGHI